LKNSRRIAILQDFEERRCLSEAEIEIQFLRRDINIFSLVRPAERIVIDAPLESRFESMWTWPVSWLALLWIEATFPVHSCTSGALASILYAYSGWAAPELNRIPIQHQVTSFIRDGTVLVKSWSGRGYSGERSIGVLHPSRRQELRQIL